MYNRLYVKYLTWIFILVFCTNKGLSETVTIAGEVRNPADKVVKKATVSLRSLKDEILYEDITNRKGEFRLEEVEPKFYYLLVEHDGDGSKRIKINYGGIAVTENHVARRMGL